MIDILIYQNGKVVKSYTGLTYDEARKRYRRSNIIASRYTQLIVDGIPYNTAKSEGYFGFYKRYQIGA